jgi:hypothetical protein
MLAAMDCTLIAGGDVQISLSLWISVIQYCNDDAHCNLRPLLA